MGPSGIASQHCARNLRPILMLSTAALFLASAAALCLAQDIPIGATYVCGGERLYVENCNIRDTSDTSTCMVGHPDRKTANGLMAYTTETRGTLKKLLPTCQQPTAKNLAAAQAFQKRQQDQYNANEKKANDQLNAANQPVTYGQPQKPRSADERAVNRCLTSGRLPASCTGNALLGAFGQMLSSVLPGANAAPKSGPVMAGVFEGAGHWRLDFIDGGVLVNCSYLSPDQRSYKLEFHENRTVLVIDMTPKPLLLTVHPDGTIIGPGPVTIDGVVASGTGGGQSTPGHTDTQVVTRTDQIDGSQAQQHIGDGSTQARGDGTYDYTHSVTTSTYTPGTSTPTYSTFSHRRVSCAALNLSSKNASVGIQTMQTDLLKTMLGGDKGPPTPPGIRMQGIFAASHRIQPAIFP